MGFEWVHGGTDALGVPAHDFSTNRNACGPCPMAVDVVQAASTAQYPDPVYTDVREQLAQWHGVSAQRVLMAGSASEWIHRITMHVARQGGQCVVVPQHHYGDYAQAAAVWGLPTVQRGSAAAASASLHWACAPSSPLGQEDAVLADWVQPAPPNVWRVLDCAYAPLRLEATASPPLQALKHVWQMWTPNKALGMTGIRAAYVIAPEGVQAEELAALRALAPSWVVGAHGVAMLQAWADPAVQSWLAESLRCLQAWKAQQLALCAQLEWCVVPGHQANYMVARWPVQRQAAMAQDLAALRSQGIKLRDCSSFGLPGHVRMGVLPPISQQALHQAWVQMGMKKD